MKKIPRLEACFFEKTPPITTSKRQFWQGEITEKFAKKLYEDKPTGNVFCKI